MANAMPLIGQTSLPVTAIRGKKIKILDSTD